MCCDWLTQWSSSHLLCCCLQRGWSCISNVNIGTCNGRFQVRCVDDEGEKTCRADSNCVDTISWEKDMEGDVGKLSHFGHSIGGTNQARTLHSEIECGKAWWLPRDEHIDSRDSDPLDHINARKVRPDGTGCFTTPLGKNARVVIRGSTSANTSASDSGVHGPSVDQSFSTVNGE